MPGPGKLALRWPPFLPSQRSTPPVAPITFPSTPLRTVVEMALGADPGADPGSWTWTNVTQWVRKAPGVVITRGRRNEGSRVDTSRAQLTLINTDGRWVRRNPLGVYYGLLSRNTPIRIGVDPGDGIVRYRFWGFVNEWPTRWSDESGAAAYAPIVCSGVMRRLRQGQQLKSALTRSIGGIAAGDFRPVHYWPMEDGAEATAFASNIAGDVTAAQLGTPSLAANSDLPGSAPLPTFPSGSGAYAAIPTYTATGDKWAFQFVLKITTKPSAATTYMEVKSTGNNHPRWTFTLDNIVPGSADFMMRTYDAAGALTGNVGIPIGGAFSDISEADFYGKWLMYTIAAWADPLYPGQLSASFNAQLSQFRGSNSGILLAGGIGTASSFKVIGQDGVGFGHLALFTDTAFDLAIDTFLNADAMNGWAGEMAHVRGARLCREEGVRFYTAATVSAAMGAQRRAKLLENLEDCEQADLGVLYEYQHGLGFQSLDERLNAPVALTLDFASRHIGSVPQPTDDDQRLIDTFTAGRSGGSSATVADADSIQLNGTYEGSGTFNVASDSQLADIAGMTVRIGVVDEDRWPSLLLRFARTPDLIDDWCSLGYGPRVQVLTPPVPAAPDPIDQIIEGSRETIKEPVVWEADLNLSPASPYRVGAYAESPLAGVGPTDGFYSADSCVLAAPVNSTTQTWTITSVPLWTTASEDFPCPLRIGGEEVLAMSCTGAGPNQTLTVVRSTNGVVKSHDPAYAWERDIELVRPLVYTP